MSDKETLDAFNHGLAVYLEWGPAMAAPIEERLAKALPRVSDVDRAKLLRDYRDLQASAGGAVIDQLEQHRTEAEGRERVANLDPRCSADNAATLYSQARIGAWRDGYS